jgi:hypothetical protein
MREAGAPSTGGMLQDKPWVCPSHRGYSWSHRPKSRATLQGLKAKAAPGTMGENQRGHGHYKAGDKKVPALPITPSEATGEPQEGVQRPQERSWWRRLIGG